MIRLGLLADTHVPYRAPEISAELITALDEVDLILHAGDVDEPGALAPLRDLAPVYAVRGNYHLFDRSNAGRTLPVAVELNIAGFRIALTHGHQIGLTTWFWKAWVTFQNLRGRWEFPYYDNLIIRRLLERFSNADIIVFGHTHRYCQTWRGHVLVINPGAALRTSYFGAPLHPSLAYLLLERGHRPVVQRVDLA